MNKFKEQFSSICFLFAIADIFLGLVSFLVHNNVWGCIFFGAAFLLSFGIKEEPEQEDN